MGLILYDDKTIIDAKNKVDTCNEEILDALEKINNEIINMKTTLNTPKSSKNMLEFINYYNQKIAYVRNSKARYNNMFDTISREYNNYLHNIKEMVGGNHD